MFQYANGITKRLIRRTLVHGQDIHDFEIVVPLIVVRREAFWRVRTSASTGERASDDGVMPRGVVTAKCMWSPVRRLSL